MDKKTSRWFFVIFIALAMVVVFTACDGKTVVLPNPAPTEVPTLVPPVIAESPGNIPVYVPAGEFLMGSGSEDPDTQDDEFPQHEVLTSGFWIFKGEVTNAMYEECVKAGECVPPVNLEESPAQHYGDPAFANYPVVGATWEQAKNFCDTQGGRLPTEAEWEKAARGLYGQWFPWGNDDPTCSLTNMSGCLDKPDTQPEGTYPDGESPFHLFDMAGNVGEWVNDWYEPMYYDESPYIDPEGPEGGKLRVARGGSWQDEAGNVRTAARFALDPEVGYSNIGFRCVITTGGGYAPFCRPSYVPFCTPTTDDGCEEGGEPGKPSITQVDTTGEPVGQTGGGGIKVTGIGCPTNGMTEFYITVGMDVPPAYTVTLNGNPIDCEPVEGYPQRLHCVVTAMESQTPFEFIFCVGNPVGGTTSSCRRAALVQASVEPVNFEKTLSDSLATVVASPLAMIVTNPDNNCDEGYTFNPKTGQCERDPNTDNCPPGTNFAAANFNCEPTNQGDCPEGTSYNANLGGCVPDDGECPPRFVLAANQTCIPDTNDGNGICPPGYYFNQRINCCAPIPNNNYDCPPSTFYNANLQRCLPTDQNGCPYGTIYDPLQGCVRDPNSGPDYTRPDVNFPDNENCPPGTYALQVTDTVTVCVPEGQNGPTTAGTPDCYQGYHMDNSGACVPDEPPDIGEPDCGPNQYATTAGVPCNQTDDNGCRQGYHWDGKRCVPNTGTGSPCPIGYSYSARLQCCLPNPGNDGSTCPEDEGQTGQQTPGTTNPNGNQTPAGVAPGPYDGVSSFAATGFNPNSGLCDPVGDNPCSPGYHLNENKACVPDTPSEGGDDCPPGTTAAPTTAFVTPGTCIPDNNNSNCPQGTYRDTSTGACIPTNGPNDPVGQCGPNQYFDRELGYCVRRNDDCCRQGYFFDKKLGYCVPLEPGPRDPNQPQCPLYYRWNGQMCVPPNDLTQPECWSVSGRTPTCDGPCLYPLVWNRQTGECYDPNAPQEPSTPSFSCRKTYLDEKNCWADPRCEWITGPTGGSYCTNR